VIWQAIVGNFVLKATPGRFESGYANTRHFISKRHEEGYLVPAAGKVAGRFALAYHITRQRMATGTPIADVEMKKAG
jgi:hypothetical protein